MACWHLCNMNREIGIEIDALTESAAFVFQSQQEDFMKTMIAAEHAEKDLPILRARQESLVRRLERYKEAVPAQQEVVDEELNAMNDWFRIYDGSKYNREPQPGKYIDELENRCRIMKQNTLITEKNRTNAKAELIMKQKVMK